MGKNEDKLYEEEINSMDQEMGYKDEESRRPSMKDDQRTSRRNVAETAKSVKPISMMVTRCSKLNIRAENDVDSDVIRKVDKGDIIKVDPTFKDSKFFKVIIGSGVVGFAVKDYLDPVSRPKV